MEPPPDYSSASDSESHKPNNARCAISKPVPETFANGNPGVYHISQNYDNRGFTTPQSQYQGPPPPNYYNEHVPNPVLTPPSDVPTPIIQQGNCPECGIGFLEDGKCSTYDIIFNIFFGIFGLALIPFGGCLICIRCPPEFTCSHCKKNFETESSCCC